MSHDNEMAESKRDRANIREDLQEFKESIRELKGLVDIFSKEMTRASIETVKISSCLERFSDVPGRVSKLELAMAPLQEAHATAKAEAQKGKSYGAIAMIAQGIGYAGYFIFKILNGGDAPPPSGR